MTQDRPKRFTEHDLGFKCPGGCGCLEADPDIAGIGVSSQLLPVCYKIDSSRRSSSLSSLHQVLRPWHRSWEYGLILAGARSAPWTELL